MDIVGLCQICVIHQRLYGFHSAILLPLAKKEIPSLAILCGVSTFPHESYFTYLYELQTGQGNPQAHGN